MAAREQGHARRSRRRRGWVSWIPEVVVLLVVVAAYGNAQYHLGHRWFGLSLADPTSNPAAVAPPAGLDLPVGNVAPAVAQYSPGGHLDPAAVKAALAPVIDDARLGGHVTVQVTELGSGKVVYRHGDYAVAPASTNKLLTTTAALATLGPMSRFSTKVVADGDAVTLVGGGDPFLASTPAKARGLYPARADLVTLARRTAAALAARGTTRIRLSYDTSLFSGPAVDPHWPSTYVTESVVPPIGALWIDEGADADGHYVADPAQVAGDAFASALRAQKIQVVGAVHEQKAPAAATQVAAVQSAPLGEIVQETLALSDNNAAEVIAHHVGLAVDHDGSYAGGAAAVFSVLHGLGVDLTGSHVYDGSGLSRDDRLTSITLTDVLRVAASAAHPGLREVLTGLPVAGFSGSLQRRFDNGPDAARGRVRAKTGTLTGVHGLAGLATDLDGDQLVFVMIADRVSFEDNLDAQHDLDLMAGALGACHCGQ
ncbi:MAG TPA: D-alanyl-D-alanine carboxypeptidase/D-alanyl-D-alanine-endopeptidase [Marmoricola sp.]|nr:D-alanyl-D-alanine carboxypeptidase/D-alanyl-D-alanine-endopeptidase [Marmoricola sp.]